MAFLCGLEGQNGIYTGGFLRGKRLSARKFIMKNSFFDLNIYIVFLVFIMFFYHNKRFLMIKNDDFFIFHEICFRGCVRMLRFLNDRRLP